MSNLFEKYQKEIVPALSLELQTKNALALPRLVKVVINVGLKEAAHDEAVLTRAREELMVITGQKPTVRRAKKSIASFKLVRGNPIGLTVTLRGERMYNFLEKLLNIVLPRVRDFRGASASSFDGHGNYSLGIAEQIVFPEVDFAKVDKTRGLEITIVTTAKTDEAARKLLEPLGMPFSKSNIKEQKSK